MLLKGSDPGQHQLAMLSPRHTKQALHNIMNTPQHSPPERPDNVKGAQDSCAPAPIAAQPQALFHGSEPTSLSSPATPSSNRKRIAASWISATNGPPSVKRQRDSGPNPCTLPNPGDIPDLKAELKCLEILKGKTRAAMDAFQDRVDRDKAIFARHNLFDEENSGSDCEEETSTEAGPERVSGQEVGTMLAENSKVMEEKALQSQVVQQEQQIRALFKKCTRRMELYDRWSARKRAWLNELKELDAKLSPELKAQRAQAAVRSSRLAELEAALTHRLEEAKAKHARRAAREGYLELP